MSHSLCFVLNLTNSIRWFPITVESFASQEYSDHWPWPRRTGQGGSIYNDKPLYYSFFLSHSSIFTTKLFWRYKQLHQRKGFRTRWMCPLNNQPIMEACSGCSDKWKAIEKQYFISKQQNRKFNSWWCALSIFLWKNLITEIKWNNMQVLMY